MRSLFATSVSISRLSTTQHVCEVAAVRFYHVRRIRQIFRHIEQNDITRLFLTLITSRLDYCNSTLTGLYRSGRSSSCNAFKMLRRVQFVNSVRGKMSLQVCPIYPGYLSGRECYAISAPSCTHEMAVSCLPVGYSLSRAAMQVASVYRRLTPLTRVDDGSRNLTHDPHDPLDLDP
jgi:hypothetical protein